MKACGTSVATQPIDKMKCAFLLYLVGLQRAAIFQWFARIKEALHDDWNGFFVFYCCSNKTVVSRPATVYATLHSYGGSMD
jgi:hypothetical protein